MVYDTVIQYHKHAMEIKFVGDPMSVWAFIPDNAPDAGASFSWEFGVYENSWYVDKTTSSKKKGLSFTKGDGALFVYDTDHETIRKNRNYSPFKVRSDLRLIDTRYGLVLLINWTIAEDSPQEASMELIVSMHDTNTIANVMHIGNQDIVPLLYCDLNTREVVRTVLFPQHSGLFFLLTIFCKEAHAFLTSGKAYADKENMQKAASEVSAHVDSFSSPTTRCVEKTYSDDWESMQHIIINL